MHESDKLLEARHFLDQMKQAEAKWDERLFSHELSAFLSAARSVLQYLYGEAKAKGRLQWYEAAIKSDACIVFLKDARDLNVHRGPVPLAAVESQTRGPLVGGEQCGVLDREFYLWDWRGPEGAVQLAERYLAVLHAVVRDAQTNKVTAG